MRLVPSVDSSINPTIQIVQLRCVSDCSGSPVDNKFRECHQSRSVFGIPKKGLSLSDEDHVRESLNPTYLPDSVFEFARYSSVV